MARFPTVASMAGLRWFAPKPISVPQLHPAVAAAIRRDLEAQAAGRPPTAQLLEPFAEEIRAARMRDVPVRRIATVIQKRLEGHATVSLDSLMRSIKKLTAAPSAPRSEKRTAPSADPARPAETPAPARVEQNPTPPVAPAPAAASVKPSVPEVEKNAETTADNFRARVNSEPQAAEPTQRRNSREDLL